MNRRTLLLGTGGAGMAAALGWWAIPGAAVSSVNDAVLSLAAWQGRTLASSGVWSPHEVFTHLTQSVDYSMTGYPVSKSALFRHTAGRAAFSLFSKRGILSHSLTDPVPGAPPLGHGDPQVALTALITALERFDAFEGALHPHFAYGALAKADYARAHVLHLEGHLTEIMAR